MEAKVGKLDTSGLDFEAFAKINPFKSKLPEKKEPVLPKPALDNPPKVIPTPIVKDDTAPKNTKTITDLKWKITGIIWNSERPQAIINDRVVDVGDKIDDAQIMVIKKSGIDVLFNGEKVTIKP